MPELTGKTKQIRRCVACPGADDFRVGRPRAGTAVTGSGSASPRTVVRGKMSWCWSCFTPRCGPGSSGGSRPGRPSRRPEGWQEIAAGRHTLIAAPTGSGKTLAAFLVCIDRIYRAHDASAAQRASRQPAAEADTRAGPAGPQVVYVSPLKALAVDIRQNLERPLAEIAEVAAELGLTAPDIRVAVRTGDTAAAERAAMLKRPPDFLITTPESLYLLVTAERSRAMLAR